MQGVGAGLPRGACRPRDLTNPFEHVYAPVRVLGRLGDKPIRVVAAPLLPLFFEPIEHNLICLFFIEFFLHIFITLFPISL